MKILIVSTLKRKVTAEMTASRSRIIFELASGLAKKGHEVSLLGTSDSLIPQVNTISVIEKGWVDLPPVENDYFRNIALSIQQIKKLVEIQESYDVIHNNLYPEFMTPVVEAELSKPMLTTVHVQATDYIDNTLCLFKKTKFVSISKAHRSQFPKTNFYKIVYNGIDTELFAFNEKKEDYLLWIGRLSKAKNKDGSFMDPKGIKHAIRLAKDTNSKLLLAGSVEDIKFFNQEVKPYLNDKIKWIGPVSPEQKLTRRQIIELMQKAKCFLMTVNWFEPFGLVMAEAQSCGTPVIGFDRGSVHELVIDGKTGFVVSYEKGIGGLKAALDKINQIKPEDCRQHVVNNFSLKKMVENYEKIYKEII